MECDKNYMQTMMLKYQNQKQNIYLKYLSESSVQVDIHCNYKYKWFLKKMLVHQVLSEYTFYSDHTCYNSTITSNLDYISSSDLSHKYLSSTFFQANRRGSESTIDIYKPRVYIYLWNQPRLQKFENMIWSI